VYLLLFYLYRTKYTENSLPFQECVFRFYFYFSPMLYEYL
jgi:hypothetical protein